MSFKEHVKEIRRKTYAKVGALRRLKRVIPSSTDILLYKAYVLPHLEYCSPLMLGTGMSLNKKMKSTNYYALRILLGVKKDTDYDSVLEMAGLRSLEHRKYEQELTIVYQCLNNNGPIYISDFLKKRKIAYNLIRILS